MMVFIYEFLLAPTAITSDGRNKTTAQPVAVKVQRLHQFRQRLNSFLSPPIFGKLEAGGGLGHQGGDCVTLMNAILVDDWRDCATDKRNKMLDMRTTIQKLRTEFERLTVENGSRTEASAQDHAGIFFLFLFVPKSYRNVMPTQLGLRGGSNLLHVKILPLFKKLLSLIFYRVSFFVNQGL